MSPLRIALVAGGLLLAGGALFLLFGELSGGSGAPPAAADAAAPESELGAKGKNDKAPPPAWQGFLRPDAPAQAMPRPLARLAISLESPFVPMEANLAPAPAQAQAQPHIGPLPLFRGVSREPAKPVLRLEGVAAGPPRLALISGKVVRPGDTIQGYRVVRVGTRDVSLQGSTGKRLELVLGAAAEGSGS